ncbi:hypothetical protein PIB30_043860 [Stylosanthes scabra]|uniref:Uncharacterized protein n=1 Tax=Stylosanthes scabra TaxID=79078 RepID=A0ABU6ZEE0_9FABA|nr:hypothetical protein [Stylosanthes scabra]
MDEYQPTHYVAVENEFEHGIVKTLFNRITIKLRRDWFQSMHVIAMLIWLEKAIFHGSIKKFVALPHDKMDQLVDEALICLNVIENPITFPETIQEYGEDYVQKITMKDSLVIGQARYARVLFQNFETVERILNGGEKVELVIHGKIVRARRFKKFEK